MEEEGGSMSLGVSRNYGCAGSREDYSEDE